MSVNWKSLVEAKLKGYEGGLVAIVKKALDELSEDYIVNELVKKKNYMELCNITSDGSDKLIIFDFYYGRFSDTLPPLDRDEIRDIVTSTIKSIISDKGWEFEVISFKDSNKIYLDLRSAYN